MVDKISVIYEAKVKTLREGKEVQVDLNQIVQDDIETEVDKETWGDEPEQVEEPLDNSDMISVDDEEV